MSNAMKVMLWCVGIIVLFLHPVTRQIMIFILPLGSGWDDFIVVGAFVIFIIVSLIGGTNGVFKRFIKKTFKWLKE